MTGEASEEWIAAGLVRRIGEGDLQAETDLVARYSRGLLFHLRRMTKNPAASDDLHQETFRVVLERLRGDGLGAPEQLSGFIFRTARNLFLGEYRKQRRHGEGEAPEEIPETEDPAPGQLETVLREEEAALVQRLIGELGTERDRHVLLRFYVAEEDKERICGDFGLSALHFNRVLFRARQRLKELLLEQQGGRLSAGKTRQGVGWDNRPAADRF
jgi:RNA polymerase sigma-70 factor (ECF subfamily)